jgi:hypothetical protein
MPFLYFLFSYWLYWWRRDTPQSDTKFDDTWSNNTRHSNTPRNCNIPHNDTTH